MAQRLTEFAEYGGESSPELPLARGMARVFCALLEEDRAEAETELVGLSETIAQQQSTFFLSGTHGLKVLLDVLAGRAGWAEHAAVVATAAGGMRWNRQWLSLAEAVLLGRGGQAEQAVAAYDAAAASAAPFRTAYALGLRLVAEAAADDGWGEPDVWLRVAEDHFHRAGVPAVASACRTLLRRAGATVGQRRAGVERVPDRLRRLGVTVREYEVYQLLVHRLGNKALAARLHISPRTVEKHVASLLAKTALPDRAALAEDAALELGAVARAVPEGGPPR
jgi:DNA-binding CsgD family transcriptional regulator